MGMVAPVPVAVGPRAPMMSNGVPPMVPVSGYMGRYCTFTWPRYFETFSMQNAAKHEIFGSNTDYNTNSNWYFNSYLQNKFHAFEKKKSLNCWYLNIYNQDKFTLSRVEHGKSSLTSGPDLSNL